MIHAWKRGVVLAAAAAALVFGWGSPKEASAAVTCKCNAKQVQGIDYDFSSGSMCGTGKCSCWDNNKTISCGGNSSQKIVPTAADCNESVAVELFSIAPTEKKYLEISCTVIAQDPDLDKMDCVTAAKTKFGDRYVEASCSPSCPKPLEEVTNTAECKNSPSASKICCAEVKPLPAGATSNGSTTPPPNLGSPTTLPDPLGGANLFQVVNRVVSTFLGVVGSIALLAFVYAGLLYMISSDAKAIAEAKVIMTNTVIGLVILMFAYTISVSFLNFIMK
jgi:hypothetical protein